MASILVAICNGFCVHSACFPMFIFYYIYFFGWKRSSVVQNMALIDPCCDGWDKLLMKGCEYHEDSVMSRSVKGCIYI
jgi:hypothetical protein